MCPAVGLDSEGTCTSTGMIVDSIVYGVKVFVFCCPVGASGMLGRIVLCRDSE